MYSNVEFTHLQLIGGGLLVLNFPPLGQAVWLVGIAIAYFLTRGDEEWRERW